jgi:hypothetical protein
LPFLLGLGPALVCLAPAGVLLAGLASGLVCLISAVLSAATTLMLPPLALACRAWRGWDWGWLYRAQWRLAPWAWLWLWWLCWPGLCWTWLCGPARRGVGRRPGHPVVR